jgi:hypothetical protein
MSVQRRNATHAINLHTIHLSFLLQPEYSSFLQSTQYPFPPIMEDHGAGMARNETARPSSRLAAPPSHAVQWTSCLRKCHEEDRPKAHENVLADERPCLSAPLRSLFERVHEMVHAKLLEECRRRCHRICDFHPTVRRSLSGQSLGPSTSERLHGLCRLPPQPSSCCERHR